MSAPSASLLPPSAIEDWRSFAGGAFLPATVDVADPTTLYAECSAPVNIAVIKYWGKRDEKLILPINSSLSASLNQADLSTRTIAVASPHFPEDRMWLNGTEEDVESAQRMQNCLQAVRRRLAGDPRAAYRLHIWSVNNFPTAAGLASSASGFACFVMAVATCLRVPESYPGEYSAWARQGSGSACRSLYGGWVKWVAGVDPSGTDSIAVQVASEDFWSDMNILVCVVNDAKKGVSSTSGMQTTVQTCELLQARIACAEKRVGLMEEAIRSRDWNAFAELTMRDSNQFHAIALDTYPPIFYMNDISRRIVQLLTALNAEGRSLDGNLRAAYTYDAGPNAVIYVPRRYLSDVLRVILFAFPSRDTQSYFKKQELLDEMQLPRDLMQVTLPTCMAGYAAKMERTPDTLKYVLHTTPGPGPLVLQRKA